MCAGGGSRFHCERRQKASARAAAISGHPDCQSSEISAAVVNFTASLLVTRGSHRAVAGRLAKGLRQIHNATCKLKQPVFFKAGCWFTEFPEIVIIPCGSSHSECIPCRHSIYDQDW